MVPQIKLISPEHYFNGNFVETTLFADGNFIITYNGVGSVEQNTGKLPEGINVNDIINIRMADHVSSLKTECGPIAVFVTDKNDVMIYEYRKHSIGYWRTTNLKISNISRIYSTTLPLKLVDRVETPNIISTFYVGMFDGYDL
jgi:hypothetical protein